MVRVVAWLLCLALAFAYDERPTMEPGMNPGKFPMGPYPEEGDDPYYANMTKLYLDLPPGIGDMLLGTKYKPGELVDNISQKEVNRALDDVVKAGKLMHDRGCSIAIANEGPHDLENPRFHLYSGMIFSAPPPDVTRGQAALLLFVKKDWQATGTVGVITYDIKDTNSKVAIMWSVPFDFNVWDVWYNVKVYPKSFDTESFMYNQMYYYAGAWRPAGWETREERGVSVRAVMTDNIQAKIMVWVDSSKIDPEAPVELYADCSYHSGWAKNYCWKECHNGGYCWVNHRCGKASDCGGPIECYESCKKTNG